jgi:hypothetical protein
MKTSYVKADAEIMNILTQLGIRWRAGGLPTEYTEDGAYDYITQFPTISAEVNIIGNMRIGCWSGHRQTVSKPVFLAELFNWLMLPASPSHFMRG